jgi:S-DNA-T family DNA segregation ATPase FtsK/SpoIIIE
VIGVDVMGNAKKIDVRKAPHILAAGTSGSGKSVFLNTTIKQLMTWDATEIILIDPKMVELSQFEGEKNVREYADDPAKILKILNKLNKEMDERYAMLKKAKIRSIMEGSATMKMPPYIILIIDEFGDLVSSSKYGQDIRHALLILAQKGRAAGIHIIVTTQHPTVKIIDGEIKANFPIRVAFKTVNAINSHVIIDESGAEKLLGDGDMLLKTHDSITRLQGYNDK